jgi:hypothetical protein
LDCSGQCLLGSFRYDCYALMGFGDLMGVWYSVVATALSTYVAYHSFGGKCCSVLSAETSETSIHSYQSQVSQQILAACEITLMFLS